MLQPHTAVVVCTQGEEEQTVAARVLFFSVAVRSSDVDSPDKYNDLTSRSSCNGIELQLQACVQLLSDCDRAIDQIVEVITVLSLHIYKR